MKSRSQMPGINDYRHITATKTTTATIATTKTTPPTPTTIIVLYQ